MYLRHPRRAISMLISGAVIAASLSTAYVAAAAVQPRVGEPASVYAVIKTITLAPSNTQPYGIAVDPTDDTVYVAHYNGGKVSVINGRTGTWDDTVTVGTSPWGVAVNDADDSVYVTNAGSNSVSIFGGRTPNAVTTVSGVSQPQGVAVDQSDDTVYIPKITGANLAYFNGATPGSVGTLSLGGQPTGVTVNSQDDTVYVTNIGVPDAVWVVNGRTGSLDDTVNVGSNPFWVAVDQTDDTVYTSNATGDSVTVIKGSSRAVTATISLGGGANPEGVAVNPADHKVFVANAGPDYVSVIDGVTGTRTDDTIAVGQQPSGVAVDDSGAFNAGLVYVANRNTGGPGSVSVIGKATPASSPSSGPAGTTVTLTLTVPNLAPGYVMDDSTVKNVYFDGVDVGTVTRGAGNTWTVVAPAGAAGSTAAVTVKLNGARIASAGTFTYNNPTPPPPPVDPPGAPTNVKAEPGYESASVTFDPPASSGTYPISRYRVTSQPGGQVCYVTPPGGAQGGDGGVGGIGGVGPGSAGPRAVDPPSTYAEIKTIRVGTYPGSVAVNNASDKVYVGNRNSNNVSVIDGKTGLRTDDTLTTGTLPTSVAVNQKDDTVYVGNGNSYSLSVFNGKASGPRTADATVPLSPVGRGNGPSAVVVDQRDGTVYVPDYGTSVNPGAVSVLNGSTNAVTRTFPVGVSPMGAALHEASDTLYLTNWVPKNVWAVNARTGARIGEPIGLDGSASGVGVYQADGTVYAASWGTDSVAVIDGTTKAVTHTIPVQRAPQGVAVDQTDNKVFVANTQANSLSVIDGATKTVTHTLRVGMQGSFPYAVAVDGAGTNQGLVYTANYLNNSTSVVAKVTPSVSPARGPAATRATLSLSVPNLSSTFSMDSEAVKYVYLNGIAVGAVTRGTGNTWTFPVPPGRGTVPISVEFRGGLKASAGTFTYQTAPSPLSCTVPNLIPGVEYTFTVEAESQAGWGQRSTPSNPAVPYGPIKSTFTTPGIYECTVAGGVGGTGGTGAAPKAGEPVSIPFTVKGGKGGTGNQGICDGDCFEPIPNPGGFGANVSGSFDAPVGTKLYLTVGSNGRDAGSLDGGEASAGGGGGGYSAISLGADKDPIVVAGGGGGGSYFNALRVGLGSVRAKAPVTRASTPRAGLDWTAQTAPVAGLTGLAYGDGTFVAVNYFVDTQPSVITSPDGITWTARTAPQTSDPSPRTYAWHSVAYGDGTFVAVAGPRYAAPSTPAGVMRSTDRGATWSLVTPPNVDLWSVTYGDGKFVGVTRDGKSIWSDDKGLTWQLGTGVPALRWADVTYGAGRFVAVASTGTGNRVMTSPDGKTWTSRATPADEAWSGLAYGNGMFVAVSATGTNRVMSSPDGITWTLRNAAVANRWMGVTYGDGQFVAVSNGGTLRSLVMTSPDGITWTEGNPTPRAGWQMVAYGSGKFVAVNGAYGGVPQVMTSGSVGPVLPSAPTITETLPDDSRGYIYFRPPANATEAGVTNYEYQLDNGAWVTLSPASTSTTIVITGLTNGQTYSVRVRAVGANGVGEASAPATVTPDAPVEAFGNKGGKADPTATKSGGGNGGNTAGEGEFGGTLTTPGSGGRPLSTRPNSGGRGGDGGAPGAAGATATDASGGKGGGGGGGFGAPGGAGSAPNYALIASTWTPLPGAFGGGGGGGFDGGGGGGGYAGGGGGAGGAGSYGAGGGGGGSSLLVTASTAAGITNKVNGALAANSTGGSIEITNVKCGFSITYEGNGNTAGTVPTDSVVYESGSTAVAKDGTGLKKGTQVFVGWATTQSGPVAYVPGARLGPINAPVTLWAVYGAPKTVTFDANQGTGTMAPQSSGSPEALERNTFTRTDYAFTGWNTKADGTGTAYANGATYGFGADLTLYAQWRSAPTPKEEPITEPLGPGEAELKIDGKPEPVVVEPNPITDGLVVVEDDWTMTLEGLGSGGVPLPLNSDGVLVLQAERDARTTGTGFMPNSLVGLFLDPPVEGTTPAARALKTVDLGTVPVDEVGDFSGIKTLPEEIKPGLHVLQAVGYGPAGQRRALSIGILVVPWLELDQGTRKPAGRHDRMSTTGTSGGIDAGSKLTPWIKYNGQGAFKGGKANIRIKADGTFTWTRLIKKSKGLTGYVSWQDVKSNEVYWPKVR